MRGVAHAIYWKLHTAFLKNERPTAEKMLGMLEADELLNPILKDQIGAIHYARYELIRENIRNGQFGRLYGFGTSVPSIESGGINEDSGSEAEFHKMLLSKQGKERLFGCLGIESGASVVHELDMAPYGRCDFLVREGRTWHVIEVKMGEAKSSVVSQIDKYRMAQELEMCLGLHDRVEAVVVAENFTPYVAGELSRLSVQMVKHGGNIDGLLKIENT